MEAKMIARAASYGLGALMALAAPPGRAAERIPALLYEIITETGMPNLEESLRNTATRERRCLTRPDLSSAFPILDHPSFADCKLQHVRDEEDTVSYLLVCGSGQGTTGSATWQIGNHLIRGTLNVKLGGKNMTLFQRVTATPVGPCPEGGK
jgi:hypothetical protein